MNDNIFLDRYGVPHDKPIDKNVLHRDSIYGAVVDDGKILLVKSFDFEYWVLPGGGADKGETIEEALRREFLEETGFEISEVGEIFFSERLNFYSVKDDIYYHSDCKYFLVKLKNKKQDLSKLNPEDAGEIKWFNLKDLELNLLNHASRRAVERLKIIHR